MTQSPNVALQNQPICQSGGRYRQTFGCWRTADEVTAVVQMGQARIVSAFLENADSLVRH